MSRTKCPNCGCKLIATTRLEKFEWGIDQPVRKSQAKFDHDEAVKLFESGMSLGAIAQQFGVSYQAIQHVLRKRGIT